MHLFGLYLTPEAYRARVRPLGLEDNRPLDELRRLARHDEWCSCGNPAWRLTGLGLCFSCTTGQADASEDVELIPPPGAFHNG